MALCRSTAHYLSKTFLLMVSLLLILVNTSRKADAQYTPLSFAYNDEVQTSSYVINGSTYPTGTLSLGAVDFVIPSGQNNYWNAALVSGYRAANSATVTKSALNKKAATNLPATVGNIAARTTGTATLNFPSSAGSSGQVVTLSVSGTFTGGTFKGSLKVTLP